MRLFLATGAIYLAMLFGSLTLQAEPLTLEGSLGSSIGTAFHAAYQLRTTAFTIGSLGTELNHSVIIPGLSDISGGNAQVGGLKTLNTTWILQERSGLGGALETYGTLRFSTEAFVIPPPSSSVPVTGIPFTASGTLLGHDVVGAGFAAGHSLSVTRKRDSNRLHFHAATECRGARTIHHHAGDCWPDDAGLALETPGSWGG